MTLYERQGRRFVRVNEGPQGRHEIVVGTCPCRCGGIVRLQFATVGQTRRRLIVDGSFQLTVGP